MSEVLEGAIDCDVHPSVPGIQALLPYLDGYWRDIVEVRGMEGFREPGLPAIRAGERQA